MTVRLVGRKCTVKCLLNGLETDALWDTGAQVSIISHSWLKQCLPECNIWNIAKFLGMDGLGLKAANGTDIPCEGWMKLTFNFIKDDSGHTVTASFLLAKDFLDVPVVGVKVMEEITTHFDRGSSSRVNGSLVDVLTSSLTGFERRKEEALIQFIRSEPLVERKYTEDRENTVVFVSHLSPEEHV